MSCIPADLIIVLVHRVDLPEWRNVSPRCQHDVLCARVQGNEVGDVVDAVRKRHPDTAVVGACVLSDILENTFGARCKFIINYIYLLLFRQTR
jgi:hypothetical protein